MGCSSTASEIKTEHVAVEGLPLCNEKDMGWYILAGDEQSGYAIYLTTERPPFKDQMVNVFCEMPVGVMLHMVKNDQVAKGRGHGEIPFNASNGRGKTISVLSMQQATRIADSR